MAPAVIRYALSREYTKAAALILSLVFVSAPFLPAPQASANIENAVLLAFPETGIASFYSYECAGLPMANGKIFDPERNTCASWFYDFGTRLVVTSLDTGRSTEVVVTDRGPNKRLVHEGRIIDLSRKSFEEICDPEKGLTRVTVQVRDVY
jgi:rare lipoprotein A